MWAGRFAGKRQLSAAKTWSTQILAAGGQAVADRSGFYLGLDQAANLIQAAVETCGGVDVLVNNAGIVQDRMIASTSEEEFDAVIAVHLKGHFATMRRRVPLAGTVQGGQSPERDIDARIRNTSSGAGLPRAAWGRGATTAPPRLGIAALTLVGAAE